MYSVTIVLLYVFVAFITGYDIYLVTKTKKNWWGTDEGKETETIVDCGIPAIVLLTIVWYGLITATLLFGV